MDNYLITIPKSPKQHGKFRRKQSRKDVIKRVYKDSRFFDGPKLSKSSKIKP